MSDHDPDSRTENQPHPRQRLIIAFGALLILGGIVWLWMASSHTTDPRLATPAPIVVDQLTSGRAASMDSPFFSYSPGWQVSADGADPHEPSDPWSEPAGSLTFTYSGRSLALALAEGDYWGYLYVTVDGVPANQLANVSGNINAAGVPAGYKTFYAPDLVMDAKATTHWHNVHQAATDGPHNVRIEVWRSWGQMPLRAVAVDAMASAPRSRWPGVALIVAGIWLLAWAIQGNPYSWQRPTWMQALRRRVALPSWVVQYAPALTAMALVILTGGIALDLWWLSLTGIGLLAFASLLRPALWIAALLLGLPFYFSQSLPLFPGRAVSLVDVGIFGGIALLIVRRLVFDPCWPTSMELTAANKGSPSAPRGRMAIDWLLATIVGWSLISVFAADHFSVALREWRTVFLSAGLFAILLVDAVRSSRRPAADLWLLVGAWLAGATVVALIALWQYASGSMLIIAEGVRRVRAFYGSPNNLALYLERTIAVTGALALFTAGMRQRLLWASILIIQLVALLLTFSKGSIILGLPTAFITLWLGGYWLLGQRSESRRPLWWLAGIGVVALLMLTPFLNTTRFRGLLDFSQGTGFLRLQLWRSSWQMARDNWFLGVGPDNFLYAYRNEYILPAAWQEPNLNHPHNWLLDWWTRLGLVGLLLGVAFFVAGIRRLWRGFTGLHQPTLALGLLAATAAGLVHGLIDVSYALPDLMIVWVLIFYLPTAWEVMYER